MSKCRILSIFVVGILIIMTTVCGVVIFNKHNDKQIYAKSINFVFISGGIDIYIDNELIINESMVSVSPSNCTFKPEFTIKKRGEENETTINDKCVFNEEGKFTLSCRIKAGKNYYKYDNLIINVISEPTDDIDMYINKLTFGALYVDNQIPLSSIVEIKSPNNAYIDVQHNTLLEIDENTIKFLQDGIGMLEIYVKCDSLVIYKQILLKINPKIEDENIGLHLSIGGNDVQNNTIEIVHTIFNNTINYELINCGYNQTINCWTDSGIITIVSYDAPTIVFRSLQTGEAIIYVSPIDYSNVVFEILIVII